MNKSVATLLIGVAIFVGILGIVVPILPGGLLSLAAILVWACWRRTRSAGWCWRPAAALIGASQVARRSCRSAACASPVCRALDIVGVLFGIVGFFVIPVVGLFVGFPLGVYLSEWQAATEAWGGLGLDQARAESRPACRS